MTPTTANCPSPFPLFRVAAAISSAPPGSRDNNPANPSTIFPSSRFPRSAVGYSPSCLREERLDRRGFFLRSALSSKSSSQCWHWRAELAFISPQAGQGWRSSLNSSTGDSGSVPPNSSAKANSSACGIWMIALQFGHLACLPAASSLARSSFPHASQLTRILMVAKLLRNRQSTDGLAESRVEIQLLVNNEVFARSMLRSAKPSRRSSTSDSHSHSSS